ncbi:MAG: SAM-dependent methyltransferase [Acidimicrobiales bacterium]
MPERCTAYLAPPGLEAELDHELQAAGVAVRHRHGGLLVAEGPAVEPVWAANVWRAAEPIPVASIADAAAELWRRQRNWAVYAPLHRGRAGLIAARLPHVSARPLALRAAAPAAPLGSWTLLEPHLMLASTDCSSPFPNGEIRLVEDRQGPPSRAYLKLWELFVRLGRWPQAGELCVDLGASPGGWTWLLSELGARVVAVDKAPLDPEVAARPGVTWRQESAFALDPASLAAPVAWLCCDVVCYPRRLLPLIERWRGGGARNVVCTVKLQGATDYEAIARLAAIPGGRLAHLHHNKHELTSALVESDGEGPGERSG